MTMEATYVRPRRERRFTLAAAAVPGEVYQDNDGLACVFNAASGLSAGDRATFDSEGQYVVQKTTGEVWVKGCPLWWDRSAGKATCLEPIGNADRDFYLGVATADAASADTTGSVNLNVKPEYIIDSARDNGDTVIVKTVVGSTTVEVPNVVQRGGMLALNFGTTAEAQKVDWLSDRGFAPGSNWIAEILLEIVTAPDNAAVDIDVGVGSGTHATDFETVAEFAAFHLDGDDANIDAHSDDGTTDVSITDTTIDWTAGTPVRLTLDGRDIDNVKYYINGAEVLAATSNLGKLTAAAGPLFAIIHAEKTSDDSPLAFRARIRVRLAEQD